MESDVSDRSQAVLRNAVATLGIGGAEGRHTSFRWATRGARQASTGPQRRLSRGVGSDAARALAAGVAQ